MREMSLRGVGFWPKNVFNSDTSPLPILTNHAEEPRAAYIRGWDRVNKSHNTRGGGQWHVGDQLEVSIIISDFKGQPKKSGGDFLFARLHNLTLGAGVAGKVVDHLNGSYSAVFPLLWEGAAQVEVTLVHPSEAITVLNRLTSEQPDRVFFISLFRSGSRSETTTCNICLRQTKQPICDFTDPRTGDPWFCYKPKNMSCDARIAHSSQPEVESSIVNFQASGYYYQGSNEEIRYIANELDDLIGAPNTVVVFGIWAHFGSFPIEVYIRRLQRIRSAVVRLLDRAPKTVIIIRTANPKALWLYETITNSDWFSVQCDKPKMSSTIIYPKAKTEAPKVRSICNFPPLSPNDALEERLLLESVACPETPALPSPLSLELTSDPANSSFTILPARGGGQWHVGDQLEVSIIISDFKGQPKKSGGDFLFARLHNLTLGAGVAGKVVDHLNGSYSAVFPLLWEGAAQVEVTLVHPSEAITVLNRLTSEQPDRVFFISLFRSGSRSETTTCNICLRQTKQPICDFTDPRTGDPWFCYKPKNMNCDARIAHSSVGYKQTLKAKEDKLFQGRVNLKVCIPASGPAGQPEVESSIVNFHASGYYYQGLWRALDGTKVRQFTGASSITQCLKGKVVHLYGDSTIRQWFEFLNAALPGSFEEIRYIANELDELIGGPNTVVVFGIWAHFASFPIEVYIRRLQRIRSAVVRLLDRAPKTVIIIRTANPKALWLYETITNSDWFSVQCDKFLSSGEKLRPAEEPGHRGETLRPAEEPETMNRETQTCRGTRDTRRDSQTCRGTRDTEERLSDLQRNQRH
ncbi:hypothetical protein F7725_021233 [Dissostichus mawsoni]|uniref:NXPE C-terminal domain-containing protein n=1 Tax=Dissostichus mawsoni TaxID=36200 RepID=A0A7J5YFK2_DISMA|nr:hypothetical protein F7725_021233 [Dissostichus mawsoni]